MREEDASFLVYLYGTTREDELNQTDWDAETRTRFVQMQFAAQHQHYTTHFPDAAYDTVLLGAQAIGRLYVRRSESDIDLMDIAILPEFRGRGIGSRLLQALIDEAVATGRTVTLFVEVNNPRAREWYRRFGFVDVNFSGMHTEMRLDPKSVVTARSAPV